MGPPLVLTAAAAVCQWMETNNKQLCALPTRPDGIEAPSALQTYRAVMTTDGMALYCCDDCGVTSVLFMLGPLLPARWLAIQRVRRPSDVHVGRTLVHGTSRKADAVRA